MAEIDESMQRHKAVVRITIIGALINAILAVFKIIIGSIANSQALISDGIHSASDLLSDSIVVLMHRISRQGPDELHPYGHGRFETMGTVLLGSILLAVAGAMAWESVIRFFQAQALLIAGWPALIVTVLSILSKEWLFHATKKVGLQINSALVIANAWHHRSDAFSSVIVLIGLLGVMLGYTWLDTVAALIVSFMIAKIGWSLLWDSIKELVDTALPPEQAKQIYDVIKGIPGVLGVHDLRTRKMGSEVLLDVHLQVKGDLSVSEGHYIGNWVAKTVVEKFDTINSVLFHIDPENDKEDEYGFNKQQLLPLRRNVVARLTEIWQSELSPKSVEKMTLHYLDDKIFVDLFLKHDVTESTEQLAADLTDKVNESWFGGLDVWKR